MRIWIYYRKNRRELTLLYKSVRLSLKVSANTKETFRLNKKGKNQNQ